MNLGLQKNSYFRKEMQDDNLYIKELIAEGEHQQQDFKFEISNARKIAKTLVAFANTDGGRLLIGVKDNGRISGIRSEEEYYMIDAAAGMYCKPAISFECFKRIVDGKNILEVIIEASENKPHYAQDDTGKWLAYHRVDDNNFLANYILLQVWKRENRTKGTFLEYSQNEERLLELLNSAKELEFVDIASKLNFKRRELQQILINLISFQVVGMRFIESEILYFLKEQEK